MAQGGLKDDRNAPKLGGALLDPYLSKTSWGGFVCTSDIYSETTV